LGDIWRGCVTLATPAALKDELTACMYHGANDRARARHADKQHYVHVPTSDSDSDSDRRRPADN